MANDLFGAHGSSEPAVSRDSGSPGCTNAPRRTARRGLVRRTAIYGAPVVALGTALGVVQELRPLPALALVGVDAQSSFSFPGDAFSPPWPEHGQAAVTVAGSGTVGAFGEQKPVPTASVAKVMTAYIVLRDHPLKDRDDSGPQITVDAKAVQEGTAKDESRIEGLTVGQQFSEQDMLRMLMIPSGNNVARLLARWDTASDSETAFVTKMNDTARELGLANTTYTDPSGLDQGTVSTAVDQLKLAEAVMKFDAFRQVVAMPNADIPGLPQRINNNNDRLLLSGSSVRGIKTGSNTAAGGTLSWAAYKTVAGKDRLILGTMLDQHVQGADPYGSNSLVLVQDNSKKIIDAVRNALTSATVIRKGQVVGYIDDKLGGRTPVAATEDLNALGTPGQQLGVTLGDHGTPPPHGAKAGTTVGAVTVGSGPDAPTVPIALVKDLPAPSFTARLTRVRA
ncbi:D-alanyl-D-alanine carboxypeptidase family protein [Kitasatospora sp. NBC_01302]|uniref:D-alanyl-D-alanine carboxypeptidase family protein n=1 Tax=Kitasatospora sp. NBC_01302 TaxID=2903575 RepID=UPI002E15B6C7|nr:serine hydrolase [Kitasatospora sp. NBC_01302]